jgi:long-subunit fatty acid transport protein
MNRFIVATTAAVTAAAGAQAGGLDRAGNDIDILFEEGDIAELSFGYVAPELSGRDLALAPLNPTGGQDSGDAAENYFQGGIAYKNQLTDRWSIALVADQPYGADISYGPSSANIGGTFADVNTTSLSATARYQFNDNWAVHGGVRAQHLNAAVGLSGFAYGVPAALVGTPGAPAGTLNGYLGSFDGDTAYGWQVGASYEIPAIALRLTATYFSEITHDVEVRENVPVATLGGFVSTSDIEIDTPEAVNVSFQTGIAADTLLFGSFRWADYSTVIVSPDLFNRALAANPLNPATGNSLTTIDIVRDYSIGIGRRFNDRFAGSVELLYSEGGDDSLVSPLAPRDGSYGITIGGSYVVTEALTVSGGINYSRLGDSEPETGTPDVARAEFRDNDALGVGIKLSYRF